MLLLDLHDLLRVSNLNNNTKMVAVETKSLERVHSMDPLIVINGRNEEQVSITKTDWSSNMNFSRTASGSERSYSIKSDFCSESRSTSLIFLQRIPLFIGRTDSTLMSSKHKSDITMHLADTGVSFSRQKILSLSSSLREPQLQVPDDA